MINCTLNLHVLDCENLIYNGKPANDCNLFIRCHIENHDDSYCETENIENDPNPKFDEEFEFSVNDPKKDNIVIEILNEQNEDDDINFCSPIIFPIKDIKIGNDSVTNASFPLQNDGHQVGTLNLKFKLFSKDKPKFNFVSNNPILLHINIAQVPNIQKQEINDENESICLSFLLQGHDESEMIKAIINRNSLNPSWNQSFSLICNDPDHDVLNMKMIIGNQVLLDEKLEVNKIYNEDKDHLNLTFGEDIISGPLLINFTTDSLSSISKSIVKVHIKILKGTDLRKKHFGKSNPYVKILVNDKQAITDVIKSTINPEWNQEFDFVSTDPINDKLTLQLFHKSKKSKVDKKMMDPVLIPVRDLNPTSDRLPILYDIPLTYKKKAAGHLTFEIYSEGENLVLTKDSSNEYNVEFTVLEANFTNTQNANISCALKSNVNDPPTAVDLNQKVTLKVKNMLDNAIVFVFNDPETHEDLCDPFIVNLKDFSINEASEISAETFLEDGTKTGDIKIKLTVTEIQNETQESNNDNDDVESNEIKPEINELKEENQKLKAQLSKTNDHVSSLQSENQELKEENEKLKRRLNETTPIDSPKDKN